MITEKVYGMMQLIMIVLVILVVGLYVLVPHAPATPKQVKDVPELETYLNQLVDSSNPPGLSVVVVKNGRIIYSTAFGYADQPRNRRATSDTVYHWWSMTKIPTAIAIMQLREQGKLDLEDPVKKYLPWFEVAYPSDKSPTITVRNLLQHTSGLPNTMPAMIGWVHYDNTGRNQTEVTRKHLLEFSKLNFEPGMKAVYSNLNYMVLGAVLESVSGQAYEEFITQNILLPLNMLQTSFVYSDSMAGYEAAGTLPVGHFIGRARTHPRVEVQTVLVKQDPH